jgi:hypothetical protein
MTHRQAEEAIALPIAVRRGPSCDDDVLEEGPRGLYLRFVHDRLAAILVTEIAPTSIRTASGVRIGTTRDDLLDTYAGKITPTGRDGEFVFIPSSREYAGRVIVFAVVRGRVATYIAGERESAEILPCAD